MYASSQVFLKIIYLYIQGEGENYDIMTNMAKCWKVVYLGKGIWKLLCTVLVTFLKV